MARKQINLFILLKTKGKEGLDSDMIRQFRQPGYLHNTLINSPVILEGIRYKMYLEQINHKKEDTENSLNAMLISLEAYLQLQMPKFWHALTLHSKTLGTQK